MAQIRKTSALVFLTNVLASAVCLLGAQADHNDLSAYYGFNEMEIIKLDWNISNLRVADFNGDGLLDIAIVNNSKAKIELLVQKQEFGPGQQEVEVDPNDVDINTIVPLTRFDRQHLAVTEMIYSLVCGDLNSDGMMDLAYYGNPKGLYVILQKAGDDSTEQEKISEIEPNSPKKLNWQMKKRIKIDDGLTRAGALVCADLDNDGLDDLVLAGKTTVYVILQKQDGSLDEPAKYPCGSDRILGIEVGDLNGDKIADLVVITSDDDKPMRVRFGMQTGHLGPEMHFDIEQPYALELCDIDNKPGDEILTVDNRSGRLISYKLVTKGKEDADWPIQFYPLVSGEGQTKRDLVTGDFDADGLTDIVISDPAAAELILYKQVAELGLAEPVRFPALSDIEGLAVTDIDQDGRDEIGLLSIKEKLIGISRLENNRLTFPEPIEVYGEPVAMELADVDCDGNIDCIYVARDTNDVRTLRVIYNVGADELTNVAEEPPELALELKKLLSNPQGLRVVDVDQDGLPDILVFIPLEPPILIRQAYKDQFELVDSPKSQASLIKDAALHSIAVADVDDKAGSELLIAQNNFARSLVFADGQKWTVIDQYNARSTENKISVVGVFDIINNNDNAEPEIILLDAPKGQLQVLKADKDRTYRFEREFDVGKWNVVKHLKVLYKPLIGSDVSSVLLFDGDKFALMTAPSAGSEIAQRLEKQIGYETKIKDGVYGNLTVGDINSDKLPDLIMVEYKRNHIEILALDSELSPVPAMRFKVFEQKSYRDRSSGGKATVEPRELKVADVTGDGKADLVTVIHDRIIIYPQD
ncbi:MAG: VCBS repeat-containing protein [Sedimentisphaerales bacterium]|nr:VCBS repeat-containing protein [Sedimentisphaerales bacterium]